MHGCAAPVVPLRRPPGPLLHCPAGRHCLLARTHRCCPELAGHKHVKQCLCNSHRGLAWQLDRSSVTTCPGGGSGGEGRQGAPGVARAPLIAWTTAGRLDRSEMFAPEVIARPGSTIKAPFLHKFDQEGPCRARQHHLHPRLAAPSAATGGPRTPSQPSKRCAMACRVLTALALIVAVALVLPGDLATV